MSKTKVVVSIMSVSALAITASFLLWRTTSAEIEPVVKISQMIGSGLPLDVMFEKTSGIVVARLSGVHVKYAPSLLDSSGQDIMTFATADIEESVKELDGNPKRIVVRTLGGEIGKVKREAIGGVTLREDARVLLFLAEKTDGAYEIAGWQTGYYPLNEKNEYTVSNPDGGPRVVGLPESANVEQIRQMYEDHKKMAE